ncbi:MAG: hypothetical protein K8W52_24160 [Deltaproteobacteria bacterium]|nr:hypothetical protein [Deltaproteobacteria bacterium]
MADDPRYRAEHGEPCIDLRLASVEQIFDNRDPAPFRERDLDPDLVEYLMAAVDDLHHGSFRVIVWLPLPRPVDDVTPAIRAHVDYELQRLARRRREQRRTGGLAAVIGVTAMAGLLTIAQLASGAPIVREGLVILSWILLWRPVETLIYDWIPVRRQRQLLTRLLDAPIELRVGEPSAPHPPHAPRGDDGQ